jgi:hypothetical protein
MRKQSPGVGQADVGNVGHGRQSAPSVWWALSIRAGESGPDASRGEPEGGYLSARPHPIPAPSTIRMGMATKISAAQRVTVYVPFQAKGRARPGATFRAKIPSVARSALSGMTGKMAASFQFWSTDDQS